MAELCVSRACLFKRRRNLKLKKVESYLLFLVERRHYIGGMKPKSLDGNIVQS